MSLTYELPTLAQSSNNNHLELCAGTLYERGLDATISYEHETLYHSSWEYFINGYLKYDKDQRAGHITRSSFFKNYNTYNLGVAYKPCISRGRNHHGNMRIGVSAGSDREKFIAGAHIGYEHTYTLPRSLELFWQVKEDVIFKGRDLFRTGVSVGIKLPLYFESYEI